MSNGVEKYEPQINDLDEWAVKLFESGMFTDVKSAAQAFVKIAAGAEMGLTPFQSITGVHFIQNKPVVGAGLLASMLDRPPYNYTTEWEPDIATPQACTITVFKHGVERGKARFSLDDAKRAGLTGGNWQKYPTDMLFARTVSQAARRYAPGAMGTTFYVEAHGEYEIQPDNAKAKPRTRVTAEVMLPEPVENIEGEVIDDDPVTIPTVPAGELRKALAALNAHQREVLFEACGIEAGMKLGDVRGLLAAKWGELDLPDYEGEPVPVSLLGAIYVQRQNDLPEDASDAFQHFADTGEDLNAGDQAVIA